MSNFYVAGIVLGIIINHFCYQVMLRRMQEWGLPVERRSWGMGFSKNLPVYLRGLQNLGRHADGPLITMAISTLLAALCVAGWLHGAVYVRMIR